MFSFPIRFKPDFYTDCYLLGFWGPCKIFFSVREVTNTKIIVKYWASDCGVSVPYAVSSVWFYFMLGTWGIAQKANLLQRMWNRRKDKRENPAVQIMLWQLFLSPLNKEEGHIVILQVEMNTACDMDLSVLKCMWNLDGIFWKDTGIWCSGHTARSQRYWGFFFFFFNFFL